MNPFHEHIPEYKQQMQKGSIRLAYRGIMEYIMGLRTHLAGRHAEFVVSGSVYPGYLDMTYFAFTPPAFAQRGLKVAIVFLHETCRFEVWLAGVNKHVQNKCWNLIRESGWQKYHLVPSTQGADAILEHVLVGEPDFRDLDTLTKRIEKGTLEFAKDVEEFLASQKM